MNEIEDRMELARFLHSPERSFQGLKAEQQKLLKLLEERDAQLAQRERIINILVSSKWFAGSEEFNEVVDLINEIGFKND